MVVYSITNQPTKENRDLAFAYVAEHPGKMMIDHTPCGAKLVEMGFNSADSGLSADDVVLIWKEASKRMIEQAKGNVTAFVKNADKESVFLSLELPCILNNPKFRRLTAKKNTALPNNLRCKPNKTRSIERVLFCSYRSSNRMATLLP